MASIRGRSPTRTWPACRTCRESPAGKSWVDVEITHRMITEVVFLGDGNGWKACNLLRFYGKMVLIDRFSFFSCGRADILTGWYRSEDCGFMKKSDFCRFVLSVLLTKVSQLWVGESYLYSRRPYTTHWTDRHTWTVRKNVQYDISYMHVFRYTPWLLDQAGDIPSCVSSMWLVNPLSSSESSSCVAWIPFLHYDVLSIGVDIIPSFTRFLGSIMFVAVSVILLPRSHRRSVS